jgi:hypothetical protein
MYVFLSWLEYSGVFVFVRTPTLSLTDKTTVTLPVVMVWSVPALEVVYTVWLAGCRREHTSPHCGATQLVERGLNLAKRPTQQERMCSQSVSTTRFSWPGIHTDLIIWIY